MSYIRMNVRPLVVIGDGVLVVYTAVIMQRQFKPRI